VYEKGQPPRPLAFLAGDGYANQAAAFVACVRSGQPPTDGTPEQGRLAVATALSARQSIETGEVIRL
jgi:predicted dehydrogenase